MAKIAYDDRGGTLILLYSYCGNVAGRTSFVVWGVVSLTISHEQE